MKISTPPRYKVVQLCPLLAPTLDGETFQSDQPAGGNEFVKATPAKLEPRLHAVDHVVKVYPVGTPDNGRAWHGQKRRAGSCLEVAM